MKFNKIKEVKNYKEEVIKAKIISSEGSIPSEAGNYMLISEEDIFYSLPTPDEAKKLLKNYMHKLNPEESKIFNKILEIQRKINPVYGY